AAAVGADRARRLAPQRADRPVALEDPRQPATQPGLARRAGSAGDRLAGVVAGVVVDRRGAVDGAGAAAVVGPAGTGAEAEGRAAGPAPARRLHGRHAACRADGAGPGLAAARGAVPPGCDRAHAVAHHVQSPPPAAVANLQRCRAAQQQYACRRVATDVDRPAVRRAADRGAGVAAPAGAGAGVAAVAAVAAVARHRLVDQPAAAPARRVRAQRGADAFPARAGAADLGVL